MISRAADAKAGRREQLAQQLPAGVGVRRARVADRDHGAGARPGAKWLDVRRRPGSSATRPESKKNRRIPRLRQRSNSPASAAASILDSGHRGPRFRSPHVLTRTPGPCQPRHPVKHVCRSIAAASLLGGAVAGPGRADVFVLHNGGEVHGELVNRDQSPRKHVRDQDRLRRRGHARRRAGQESQSAERRPR